MLQEYTVDVKGLRHFVGNAITGEEARLILASYIDANAEARLNALKQKVDKLATVSDFAVKYRNTALGETISHRARRMVIGIVLSSLSALYGDFEVGDKRYLVSKMSYEREYNAYELEQVLDGTRSIGSGEQIVECEVDGTSYGNMIIVPRELLQQGLDYFCTRLRMRLVGNQLVVNNNVVVAEFATPKEDAKLLPEAPFYDMDEMGLPF